MQINYMHSLKRAESLMMRWMCGVMGGVMRFCILSIQSVAEVVRHGRSRWFGHLIIIIIIIIILIIYFETSPFPR